MSFERPDSESVPEFSSYDAALNELTSLSKEKRIVFVIDEYPYLAKAKPAISAMLQHIIDHRWAESRIFLIPLRFVHEFLWRTRCLARRARFMEEDGPV